MCVVVALESCLMSEEKMSETQNEVCMIVVQKTAKGVVKH